MPFKKFALPQPHLDEAIDAAVERHVAERVALRANLHSPNNRIDSRSAAKFPGWDQCASTARQ